MHGESARMQVVDWVLYGLLLLVSFLMLFPFLYIVSASLSSPKIVYSEPFLLFPRGLTLETYGMLFSVSSVWRGYLNSIFYTVVGTTLNVTVTLLGAYALSRKELYGRRVINFLIVLTLFFSGGMIPLYLVVKSLHLLNTRWAVILPSAVATWNLLITRTYFQTSVPPELYDAAHVDGASEVRFFGTIVLALSQPIIAVITLFYGSGHWNAFFNALIYLRNRDLYPLQLILREILMLEQAESMLGDMMADRALYALTLKYAIMVAAILPLLVAFPFVQRYFVKGVMIGALKE